MKRKFVKAIFIEKKEDRAIIEVDGARSEFLLVYEGFKDEDPQSWVSIDSNMYLLVHCSEDGNMLASELLESEDISYQDFAAYVEKEEKPYFTITEIKNNTFTDPRQVTNSTHDVEFVCFMVESFRGPWHWVVEKSASIVRFKTEYNMDLYLIKNGYETFFIECI